MNKEERKDMKEMIETVRILALNDPQGFMIIKSNAEILKVRHDMEMADRHEPVA
jgi:hypothetical protein